MTDDATRDTYHFEAENDLSEAIRRAVADERGEEVGDDDLQLYEDINPDALDTLLWEDARPQTSVELHTNAVKVTLWGDGGMDIQVLDEEAEP